MFLGFLPRKGGARTELLRRIAAERFTTVCYEAPGRTAALLRDLAAACGAEREGVVARELTKLHEEVRRGTLAELTAYYEEHPARGEVTIVIAGSKAAKIAPADAAPALTTPERPSDAAKELSRRLGISRQDAYRLLNR